jgi:hypothetical protein
MVGHEVAAGFLAAQLEGHFGHFRIADARIQFMQGAQSCDVGHGFDIKDKRGIHGLLFR